MTSGIPRECWAGVSLDVIIRSSSFKGFKLDASLCSSVFYLRLFSDILQVRRDGLQRCLSTHCLQDRHQTPNSPQWLLQSPECGGKAVQPEIWLRVESSHAFFIFDSSVMIHEFFTLLWQKPLWCFVKMLFYRFMGNKKVIPVFFFFNSSPNM